MIIQIVVAACAGAVLFSSISAINRMSGRTHHGIRAGFILVASGAFFELASLASGREPGMAESVFMLGCGLINFYDRRAQFRCCQRKDSGHADA